MGARPQSAQNKELASLLLTEYSDACYGFLCYLEETSLTPPVAPPLILAVSIAYSLFSQNTRVGGISATPQPPLRLCVILRRRFCSLLSTIFVPSSIYL